MSEFINGGRVADGGRHAHGTGWTPSVTSLLRHSVEMDGAVFGDVRAVAQRANLHSV